MTTDFARHAAYRIAIADDHAVVRLGVRTLLEANPNFKVCCEACDGVEAIECVQREMPDVLVLDLTMPRKNGFEVAQFVCEEMPAVAVLILSMHFSPDVARELFRYGVRGYVLKTEPNSELVNAILMIQQGKLFCSRDVAEALVDSFRKEANRNAEGEAGQAPGSILSSREIEALKLLVKGYSNREVATALGVSVRTAEAHRASIAKKMKFANFSDMVRYAIRAGYMRP